jgi:hypothetical protein
MSIAPAVRRHVPHTPAHSSLPTSLMNHESRLINHTSLMNHESRLMNHGSLPTSVMKQLLPASRLRLLCRAGGSFAKASLPSGGSVTNTAGGAAQPGRAMLKVPSLNQARDVS